MDTISLQKLKKSLPDGAIKLLSIQCSVTEDMIRKVLSGHRNSDRILDAAIELATEYKARKDQRFEAISTL
jgi:hypothetical protein